MCFVRRCVSRCRFCVHSPSDIPRPAKLREKRLRPSEQEVGGMELEVARETRSKMGLELQISLFSVSLRSHRSISPLLHRPSARSLTSERVRDTYRRVCFKESSLDDKSSDFAGFKFVTVLNCDASMSFVSYRYT